MPETVFTQLEFGYIITPWAYLFYIVLRLGFFSDKRKIAVDRVHFQLPHHGEDKNFPKEFAYSFDAGELHYDVEVSICFLIKKVFQVKVIQVESFKMGLDLATQVNEQMCEYVANGIKGRGFAEVEYRIEPY